MTLSSDGGTLYASDPTAAYSWAYNPMTGTAADQTTLVTGMNTDDHTTRTLLISEKAVNTLLVSRGSTSNIDPLASNISTGHSQIKAFDLGQVPANGYQFDTDGVRLGYVSLRADLSYLASKLSRKTCLASKRTFLLLGPVSNTPSLSPANKADPEVCVAGVFAIQSDLPSTPKRAGSIPSRTPPTKSCATASTCTRTTQAKR